MKTKLKLYVWKDFCPDYTRGLAFAIAESEDDAMRQISEKAGRWPYDWGAVEVFPINKPACAYVYGGS